MGFWGKEVELARVAKGKAKSFYKVTDVEKGGRRYIDVREHFEKGDGTLQHTTKGMAVPIESIDDLVIALQAVQEYLRSGEMPASG